ncbi:protein kinase [Gemmatirosa kalamazoonensis]|uniref:non-specific serine/threonine protein kinase n=1 Tax=Gemmatirosa kalamazoonensis TaxID=861299 RepID=W0RDQ2_9BACT|nr:protein kinase [Gemmatirosa kalamazoonensis]AHG88572.1 protein kinase [Gemmatirosa kalamazoonensis]
MKPPNAPRGDAAPLSPERWARVRALVEEALALPSDARPAFLDASCGGDDALRDLVARLTVSGERTGASWAFLARPAGELAAPLLADADLSDDRYALGAGLPLRRARAESNDLLARLRPAIGERYRVERELAEGGMATVYLAHDVKHERRVAIKVLHPELSAVLGAERFLAEIRTTAALQHPNILPLFDSGEAVDPHGVRLLFYVMPVVEGETLRARIQREQQLPVDDAVRIVTEVALALDYAHRRGVVHRDVKPENILLHEGRPLVADFGIALAVEVAQAAGAERITRPGSSLGTPPYMSPEQAAGAAALDGRSDVYSLACVLYELLVGDPPFTGRTAQVVIARVLAEPAPHVRTVRPSVPPHVDAALARALSKLPADRHATAHEFADALGRESLTHAPAAARWRTARVALGAVAAAALTTAAWTALRPPAAPAEVMRSSYPGLVDQTIFGDVTITPNGRALVYTGTVETDRPLMLQPLDQSAPRALPGTAGASAPFVAPDGRRLSFMLISRARRMVSITTAAGDGRRARRASRAWRYGNGGWDGDSAIVTEDQTSRGLARQAPNGAAVGTLLTRPDSARGESRHESPLVLPVGHAVVFTIGLHGGRGRIVGPLAIASLARGPSARGPSERATSVSPHVWLGVTARHAIAFVDGWLLYSSADGLAIMAVRLDVRHQRIVGQPVRVLEESAGSVETGALADDGTLLYVRKPRTNSLVLVDSAGAVHALLPGTRGSFMYPRFSPDGKRVAVQAVTGDGGNDVWVYDVATQTPAQLTTTGRALHPTWTPDGRRIVFMVPLRGLMSQRVDGSAAATPIVGTQGAFGPSVAPDGKTVVYHKNHSSPDGVSVWFASMNGAGPPRGLREDRFIEYMPALSPDGHWLADVSDATGEKEVYVRPVPGPGAAVRISDGGGSEPAWSPDGHRVYYRNKGAFMAVDITTPALAVTSRRRLFKDSFDGAMPHRNYDVAPDGSGFLMITGGSSEAVLVVNWLSRLREQLARER